MTGLTALIFAILEPHKSVLHGDHPGKVPPVLNATSSISDDTATGLAATRQEADINARPPSGPNSVAVIFR